MIRFYLEIFFDLALLTILDAHTMQWDARFPSITASNCLSILFIALVGSLPVYLLFFYSIKHASWPDPSFQEKVGTLLAGTNFKAQSRCLTLIIPMVFFMRRLVFVLTVIYMDDLIWGQLTIQIFVALFMVIVL